ncbi:MAG: DUF4097 family beta strand repeat-containing protein [Acidobacteriota bacterium]
MTLTSYVSLMIKIALAVALTVVSTTILFAQDKSEYKQKEREFCSSSDNSGNDRVSVNDLREFTVAAGSLNVDAGRNGGVRVKGENRSDILVRACVQAWAGSAEGAKAAVAGVRISSSGTIKAEGIDENFAVSYDIRVPRSTDLSLTAHNGGISISSVDGRLEFETTNGGVNLSDVAGDVKGRTTNGGVNVALMGRAWKGSGLDVQTSNGGVRLLIPETYAANIETGTVNGGFSSDIASLNVERNERGRPRATRINTSLNGGGAPIRVVTTNGGIRISSAENRTTN